MKIIQKNPRTILSNLFIASYHCCYAKPTRHSLCKCGHKITFHNNKAIVFISEEISWHFSITYAVQSKRNLSIATAPQFLILNHCFTVVSTWIFLNQRFRKLFWLTEGTVCSVMKDFKGKFYTKSFLEQFIYLSVQTGFCEYLSAVQSLDKV